MSASNAFETAMLNLFFNNSNIANLGDATGVRGSTAAGSVFVSLHTADPGEAGTQLTSEVAYTGYARAAVARTAGGWTIAGNIVTNAAAVTWPACTLGSATATHFAIGTETSGAGTIMFSGAMSSSLAIGVGVTPQAAIGAISTTAE